MDGARVDAGETTWEDEQAGNQYDTEVTVQEVLTHNQVWDSLCKGRSK